MKRQPITPASIRACWQAATAQRVDAYRVDDVDGVLWACRPPRHRRPPSPPTGPGALIVGAATLLGAVTLLGLVAG